LAEILRRELLDHQHFWLCQRARYSVPLGCRERLVICPMCGSAGGNFLRELTAVTTRILNGDEVEVSVEEQISRKES